MISGESLLLGRFVIYKTTDLSPFFFFFLTFYFGMILDPKEVAKIVQRETVYNYVYDYTYLT